MIAYSQTGGPTVRLLVLPRPRNMRFLRRDPRSRLNTLREGATGLRQHSPIRQASPFHTLVEAAAVDAADPRCATIPPATPSRKRGKSMARRPGQNGTVVVKGDWWHGRYYEDAPGQETRVRKSLPIAPRNSMTKPEAKRRLRELLGEAGVNTAAHLERAAGPVRTFADEAEWWRENRMSLYRPRTREAMGGHLDKYILPRFGKLPLSALDERQAQEFIAELSRSEYVDPAGNRKKLSPKSVRNIVGVLKLILGKKVWRDWNLALPETPEKEQRCFTPDEMRMIVGAVNGQWRVLFATLADTGLRCGECFGLHVEDLDLSAGKLYVRRSISNGQEGPVKTKRGYRVVNIEPALIEMLKQHLGERKTGRVFQTRTGTPFSKDNVRRKLQSTLKALGLPKGGLHAFRHGRVSILQENGVPGDLVREWMGHSSLRTTSRYTHFRDDYRQQVAAELGLFSNGTKEAELRVGPNGPNFEQFAVESNAA